MSETTDELETRKQEPTLMDVLNAISDLSRKVDGISERLNAHDIQFEAIRTGIVANSAAFDRLQARVLNLSADVKELTEEVRHIKSPV